MQILEQKFVDMKTNSCAYNEKNEKVERKMLSFDVV